VDVEAPVMRRVEIRRDQRPGPLIAEALRTMRADRGLTQRDLAKRLGVSQQRVAQLESPRGNPTVAQLDRFAAACGEQLVVVWDPRETR
jgi:XRE family transcriptional regulator, aerobic/anaerobic benzoate catabolism transcriptional regulator